MSFQCTIVTPEAQTFDQQVSQVILPAHDGMVGVLTGRAPMLVELGVGALQVDVGGKTSFFFVEGGVAQMKDNKLTLLTHMAVAASEISAEAAKAELAKAEAMTGEDKASVEKKKAAVKRATVKLAVAGK